MQKQHLQACQACRAGTLAPVRTLQPSFLRLCQINPIFPTSPLHPLNPPWGLLLAALPPAPSLHCRLRPRCAAAESPALSRLCPKRMRACLHPTTLIHSTHFQGRSPLHYACASRDLATLLPGLLRTAGPILDAQEHAKGRTALHAALETKMFDTAKVRDFLTGHVSVRSSYCENYRERSIFFKGLCIIRYMCACLHTQVFACA